MKTTLLHTLMRPARTLAFVALGVLLQVPSTARAREEWLALLPEDTFLVATIKNMPELLKDWDESGAGRFLEDPDVKKWLEPLYVDGKAPWDAWSEDETGHGLREELSVVPGATIVGLVLNEYVDEDGDVTTRPAMVSISETMDKAAEMSAAREKSAAKMIEKDSDLKLLETEIAGVAVKFVAEDDDEDTPWKIGWAQVGDLQVESDDSELMEIVLTGIQGSPSGGPEELIAGLGRFREITGGEGDLSLFVDLEFLVAELTEMVEANAGGEGGAMPFPPEMIFGLLSLDEFKGLGVSFDMETAQSRADVVVLHSENPKGIFTRLLHAADDRVTLPMFMPAGLESATVSRWSLAGFYDSILGAVNQIPMMGPMLQMQMGAWEQEVGVKIRDDLFGATDDEMVQAVKVGKDGAQSQVLGIKLKDQARFQSAIETLKGLAGDGLELFEESSFAGQKIFALKSSLPTGDDESASGIGQVAYAITKDYLLVSMGGMDALNQVLGRLQSPEGESFWEQSKVKSAVDALPAGYTGVGVMDGGAFLASSVKQITDMQQQVAGLGAVTGGKGKQKGKGKGKDRRRELIKEDTTLPPPPPAEVFQRHFGVMASGSYTLNDAAHFLYIAQPAGN
jgi:hypothetical protein